MSNIVRDKKFTELIWMGRTKDLLRAWSWFTYLKSLFLLK